MISSKSVRFIDENEVKSFLSWSLVNNAVEQALKAAPQSSDTSDSSSSLPFCCQPARSFTSVKNNGVLLSMPGFVGNYTLNDQIHNTLACKLVTCFKNNQNKSPSLPNILANILLFDDQTGQLKAVIQGTEITAWRTASASVISTKHLFYDNSERFVPYNNVKPILAIIGCGVQGRIHAIGFGCSLDFSEIRLWNRSPEKATILANELEELRSDFINKNVQIQTFSSIEKCALDADIIVTATFTAEPLIHLQMLKKNVHINAVGAGVNHHSEISQDVYDIAEVYIDNWQSAKTELHDLKANIVCEVGEVISKNKTPPKQGVTIFQSMGMASEDATVAQAVYDAIMNSK